MTRAMKRTTKALSAMALSLGLFTLVVVSPKVRVMSPPLPPGALRVGVGFRVPLKSLVSMPPLAAALVIT